MNQHAGGAAATQSVVKVQVGEKEFRFKRTLFPEDSLIPTMLRGDWLETSAGGVPFLDLDPGTYFWLLYGRHLTRANDEHHPL